MFNMRKIIGAAALIAAMAAVSDRAEATLTSILHAVECWWNDRFVSTGDTTWDPATLDWSVDDTGGTFTYGGFNLGSSHVEPTCGPRRA